MSIVISVIASTGVCVIAGDRREINEDFVVSDECSKVFRIIDKISMGITGVKHIGEMAVSLFQIAPHLPSYDLNRLLESFDQIPLVAINGISSTASMIGRDCNNQAFIGSG
ncbi:hypothetical protein [Niabella aurantiaca]|uniref:hypothetical protein n=1 Tax=Niabella aurantiaca TaxID=379900 RepID=UPI00036D85BF|nr:hypothetical protein [Niabella aurantiaca]